MCPRQLGQRHANWRRVNNEKRRSSHLSRFRAPSAKRAKRASRGETMMAHRSVGFLACKQEPNAPRISPCLCCVADVPRGYPTEGVIEMTTVRLNTVIEHLSVGKSYFIYDPE